MSDIEDGRSILAAAPLTTWADDDARVPLAALPCARTPHPRYPYLWETEEP